MKLWKFTRSKPHCSYHPTVNHTTGVTFSSVMIIIKNSTIYIMMLPIPCFILYNATKRNKGKYHYL